MTDKEAAVVDKVRELVNLSTADEIADALRLVGIKAKQGDPTSCAISEYAIRNGASRASTASTVNLYFNELFTNLPMSEAAIRFICQFDSGEYPDLVEGHLGYGLLTGSYFGGKYIAWPCGHYTHKRALLSLPAPIGGFAVDDEDGKERLVPLTEDMIGPDDCDYGFPVDPKPSIETVTPETASV